MEKEKRRLMSNIRNNCKKGRDSLRRWLSLLCLCLLAAVPAARAESLPAAISQRDSRFHTSDYRYGDRVFKENGCGPALLTNALLASLRITDEDQAAALMLDMMRLLCAPEDTSMVKLQLYCLGYLTDLLHAPDRYGTSYPALGQTLHAWGGELTWTQQRITPEDVSSLLDTSCSAPRLVLGTLSKTDRWRTLCEMADLLERAGYGDARIVVGHLAAGTEDTQGPSRSGKVGHYVCLSIAPGEFCRTSAFEVLDSQPRALDGEEAGAGTPYKRLYGFTGGSDARYDLRAFRNSFAVERLQPAMVRITPTGETNDALICLLADEERSREQRLEDWAALLEPVLFYGDGCLFLSLPPTI